MKSVISILIAVMAMFSMMACSSKKAQDDAQENAGQKSLVLYYSQTGATKAVAEALQKALNADIEEIVAVEPYDGTYDETIKRCMVEREGNIVPQIKPIEADLSQYDVIFLGYPVWFGTYARPILGLIENNDFEGKKIVPFCTFGSGGLEATTADLKNALPKAEILDGYGVRNARVAAAPAELNYFLITNGYIEGEVAPLPEFSEQQPVTEEETAIFNAACGDYAFPLGTPVTVGKRSIDKGVEYKYTVNSKDMQGNDVESTIYVIAGNEEGSKPEFTRVVR